MAWRNLVAACWIIFASCALGSEPQGLVVLGAQGEAEYGIQFRAWGERWIKAFPAGTLQLLDGTDEIRPSAELSHRQAILDWIGITQKQEVVETRWLVLCGHGTFDRTDCKFNLAGPDISATELATALKDTKHQWVIVNCSSSSGPFLSALSGPNRIVITATKSGAEQNYSRFGDYFSRALSNPASDLDHDASISVLEAFLAASNGVARFYEEDGRLASEQALLDDNGDKRGTPGAFFRGIRSVKAPADGLQLDGTLARRVFLAQIGDQKPLDRETAERAGQLEKDIEALRKRKKELSEADYYQQLEELLSQLAEQLSVNPH
jgi:hypothetical protein